MIVAVGLGNPGKKYESSRHNLGFQVVDSLAQRFGIEKWDNKFEALLAQGRLEGRKFLLVKPQTFMNKSGYSVQAVLHYYKIQLDRLLVIVDDLDLEVGKIRLREKGSDGGHRGLRSIIESMSSREFKRVRIGIGRPAPGESIVARVLKRSGNKAEAEQLAQAVEEAAGIAADFITTEKFENWSSH